MKSTHLLAGLSALAAAACVSAPPPPPPAVLTFTPQVPCTGAVSLATPISLTPEKGAAVSQLEHIVPISASAPCIEDDAGAKKPYAVFALPTSGKVVSVSAGAVVEGGRLFAPAVFTLGANNTLERVFSADKLTHRGRTLSVLFSPTAKERYVVVATDPAAIGKKMQFSAIDPAAAEVPAHLAKNFTPDAYRGLMSVAYSYEGQVFARVYFGNPAPPAPAPSKPAK